MTDLTPRNEELVKLRSHADALGAAAADRVIREVTAAPTRATAILKGYEKGDIETFLLCPSPYEYEIGGDLVESLLAEPDEDVTEAFEDGFYDAFWGRLLSWAERTAATSGYESWVETGLRMGYCSYRHADDTIPTLVPPTEEDNR